MASILTYTIANIINEAAENDRVRNPVTDFSKKGLAVLSCEPTPKNRNGIMLQLDAVCIGYIILAAEYPENIRFDWNRHENRLS
jgi:hypothetical protein